MTPVRWPDDHPNAKILMLVSSSRLVLARAPRVPETEQASATLDRIEALIGQMRVGARRDDVDRLVFEVSALVGEAIKQMTRVHALMAAP